LLSFNSNSFNYEKIEHDTFFQHSLDLLVIVGFEGLFKVVSPSVEKNLGWKKEEIVSKPFIDFVHPDDRSSVTKFRRFEKKEEIEEFETRYLCKEGSYRWISWKFHLIPSQKLAVGVGRDITHHKQAEVELEKLASFPELNPNYIVEVDFDGKVTYINPSAKKNLPTIQELAAAHPFLKDLRTVIEELKKNQKAYREIKAGDHWVSQEIYRVPDRSSMRIVAADIDDRKQAEEALRESETKFRTMAEFTYDWEYWISPNGSVVYTSPSCQKLTGYTQKEFYVNAKLLTEIVYPQDKTVYATHFALAALDPAHELDFRIITKDGDIRWIAHACRSVFDAEGNWLGRRVSDRDITQRKKVEEQNQKQARLIDLSPDGIFVKTVGSVATFWSKGAEKLYGWTKEEVLGKRINQMLQTKFPEPEGDILKQLEKNMQWSGELVHHTKSGKQVVVQSYWLASFNEHNRIAEIFESNVDITERKKIEKQNERQARLIDLSPDGIFVIRGDANITFWSKGAEKLYGWTKEEALGKKPNQLFKTKFPEPIENIFKKIKVNKFWSGEIVDHTKTGKKIVLQSYWLATITQTGEIQEVFISNVDVTERARLQEKLEDTNVRVEEYANQMEELAQERLKRLKDVERLATIGQTAGMVGHDIRNPLQSIVSELYLAKQELARVDNAETKHNLAESINNIENDVFYINKIVQDLQDYAKPLTLLHQVTDLNYLCKEIFKTRIPSTVKVQCILDVEEVVADPEVLRRIIANLLTNAVQAMPDGGDLKFHAYKDTENNIVIAVTDTGAGIPEEAKPKLFTPMFTTKAKGQGFGLAVVKRLTEAMGGKVAFESEIGKGTTFTVILPSEKPETHKKS
jgi:PAS domain S-box-containing protein